MNESLRKEIERFLYAYLKRGDVIRLYFGLSGSHPMTLEEIGERFDLLESEFVKLKKIHSKVKAHFPQ